MQTGFGRLGSNYWGFETQDVVPDIGMPEIADIFLIDDVRTILYFIRCCKIKTSLITQPSTNAMHNNVAIEVNTFQVAIGFAWE